MGIILGSYQFDWFQDIIPFFVSVCFYSATNAEFDYLTRVQNNNFVQETDIRCKGDKSRYGMKKLFETLKWTIFRTCNILPIKF